MAEDLHEEPRRVATRADRFRQRLLAGLDAWLHPDRVGDVFLEPLVHGDEHLDGATPAALDAVEPRHETRPILDDLAVRRELVREGGVVAKRILLGVLLDEEVE